MQTYFSSGLDASNASLSSDLLMVDVLGGLFMMDFNPKGTFKAGLIKKIERSYKVTDEKLSVQGYKATILGANEVWFEGSYAVALLYHKLNNVVKSRTIIQTLNLYIDEVDGSQKIQL